LKNLKYFLSSREPGWDEKISEFFQFTDNFFFISSGFGNAAALAETDRVL
jgi:hypothetical protein